MKKTRHCSSPYSACLLVSSVLGWKSLPLLVEESLFFCHHETTAFLPFGLFSSLFHYVLGVDWIDFSRLIALNRHLYLIGSTIGDTNKVGRVELRYIDLDATLMPIWHIGGGVNSDRQYGAILERMAESLLREITSTVFEIQPLGSHLRHILGVWSTGVILFDNSLLFSLGTQNPSSDRASLGFEAPSARPGVYVFDIRARRWLSSPLEGLQNELGHENFGPDLGLETFLPNQGPYDRGDVHMDGPVNPFKPWWVPLSLVKVGVENGDHKLGFVWDRMIIYDNQYESTYMVMNCTPGLVVAPDEGNEEEKGDKRRREGVTAPDGGNEEERDSKRRGENAPNDSNEEENGNERSGSCFPTSQIGETC
ncbi:hypothetical protein Pyn_35016 [Prunus yedoensis var. nudiflora]|uniref:Uncharacterized protein n=1 Tax=Prunus yedoensis var. nudiflora TaxID=2094558 RepID=A0A314UPV0_PRUYE|nr:hypothetical protein Pyn_35016 [Prunus yedoensis var. nudiflora]